MNRTILRNIIPLRLRQRVRIMLSPLPPYAEVISWTDGIVQLLEQRILRLESQVMQQSEEIDKLRQQIIEQEDHGR